MKLQQLSNIFRSYQMLLVEEAPVEPETVILVIRIGLVQSSQMLKLLQSGFMHNLVISNDFDADLINKLKISN